PYCLGHARSTRGRVAFAQSDALLAVGCRFTEVFTYFRRLRVPQNLIQIDIDPGQIGLNYPVKFGLVGDATQVIEQLRKALPIQIESEWGIWDDPWEAVHPKPEWLIEILRAELPEDAPLFTDACEMAFRMHLDYPV